MQEDRQANETDWTACEGFSEESGKSINPGNLPEDEPSPDPTEYKEIPIGLPISHEQYKALKEVAKKDKPPSQAKGQIDSST